VTHSLEKADEANSNVSLLQILEYRGLYERDTADQNLSVKERVEATQRLQSALRSDPIGIGYLKSILAAIKAEIQDKGRLPSEALDTLMCTVGYCDNALIHACIPLAQAKNGPEPVVPESDADQDCVAQKALAIALLTSAWICWNSYFGQ
jgi:hypothetical protein